MTALLMMPAGPLSSISLYLTVASLGVLMCVFAPQPVLRDKRVIVAAVVFVAVCIVGQRLDAFVSTICSWAWWAPECWLF